jgi:thymidine kinase
MGTLELIYGCMFSGKTSKLIDKYNELKDTHKCLAVNYIFDKRYTNGNKIISHNNVSIDCVCIQYLHELTSDLDNLDKFNESEYIFINEAQFFQGLKNWVLYVKNTLKKNIILCGLDLDFKREKFGEMMDLTIVATKTFRMLGTCHKCGNASLYTHRIVNNKAQVLIGVSEYIPVCDNCWNLLNKKTTQLTQVKETYSSSKR